MGVVRVIGGRGDTSARWDAERVRTGDPEARAAVAEAERLFREARARGATAFGLSRGESTRRLERFDLDAEQIVLVPQMVGG